jgi:hypothetical protein
MKHPERLVVAVLLILLSFWGGAWLLEIFPTGPYNAASFFTSVLLFVSGIGLAISSVD